MRLDSSFPWMSFATAAAFAVAQGCSSGPISLGVEQSIASSLGDSGSTKDETPDGNLDASPFGCATFTYPDSSVAPACSCLCTRRDWQPTGIGCPKGAGQSIAMTVGAAGGTLRLAGQQGQVSGVAFSLTIPPGALAADVQIVVTETSLPPPDGFVDWSPVYAIEPAGLTFSSPASLDVPFSNGNGAMTLDKNLAIFSSSGLSGACALSPLSPASINAGFAQAATTHGGFLIVGYASAGGDAYCSATTDGGEGQ